MGSLNSRGIYIYDVNDSVAPIHELLNLGQSATSAALDEVKQEIIDEMTPDDTGIVYSGFGTFLTGWTNAATSSSHHIIRRKGDRIYIRIRARRTGATINVPNTTGDIANQRIFQVNPEWRPPFYQPLFSGAGAHGRLNQHNITHEGIIAFTATAGTRNVLTGDVISLHGTYFLW